MKSFCIIRAYKRCPFGSYNVNNVCMPFFLLLLLLPPPPPPPPSALSFFNGCAHKDYKGVGWGRLADSSYVIQLPAWVRVTQDELGAYE